MIRKYTVTRVDVDYYTIQEQELINGRWDIPTASYSGRFPECDIPPQAAKRNPRIALRKNGQSYTFMACVFHFPEPRLMGKFQDYTSAYGWSRNP